MRLRLKACESEGLDSGLGFGVDWRPNEFSIFMHF